MIKMTLWRKSFPWHLAFPGMAMLLEIGTVIALWIICTGAYGQPAWIAESLIVPLTGLALSTGGIIGGILAVAGVYLLIIRWRLWVSVTLIALVCLPSMLCACIFTYALFVFLCLA